MTHHQPTIPICQTRRQHFNHLRNCSNSMQNCLAWSQFQDQTHYQTQIVNHNQSQIAQNKNKNANTQEKQRKNVSFDTTRNIQNSKNKNNQSPNKQKQNQTAENNKKNTIKTRPSSAKTKQRGQDEADIQIRKRIRDQQLEQQNQKKAQRRQKVINYIEQLKPFTRSLTNTKYQDYFDKAALESYGRANTKNAVGGIIYGLHQKTFNMNPHIRGNQPKTYQSHQTAINFSKRTKLNDNDKWTRLQKQLSKKLGLKQKNETLKQGKQVVYVDVDDQNMYKVMKQNLKFKKQNNEKIRNLQKDYQADIQQQKKQAVQQFYQDKKQRILSGGTVESQLEGYQCGRDQKQRLQQQVIYRHTDEHGCVRIGADRHALTCFVDMNFPQNDAAYTQQLINRNPIYQLEVKSSDKFIDNKRRENYQKSLQNIYPSHYLLPVNDQPQIIKMINTKYKKDSKVSYDNKKRMASTFGTNAGANDSQLESIEN